MTGEYDIVVMGAGHNGLVAACYLAKAGKKVLVLERKEYPGGGVVTREINTPGFWHDEHSSVHIMIQGNPMITNDELGLFSKFGFEYNYPDVPHATIFPDQTTLISYKDLDATCEQIAQYSDHDAEAYRRLVSTSNKMLPMMLAGLDQPPPPLGSLVNSLDQSDEGRFTLDCLQRSAIDIANQWFEHDRTKIHLVRLVTENLQMPDELGTGLGVVLMPGIMHSLGVSQPVGGSGKLTEALVRCLEHHGGELRLKAEVQRVLVSGGRATGLELDTGERFTARDGVIGAIHPQKLRQFVDGVPEAVLERAERTSLAPFTILASHYDLNEKATFYAGDEVRKAVMLELMASDRLIDMMDDFDQLRRGRITARRLLAGGDETHNDPSRAPEGKGIWHGISFAPYELEDGGHARWDDYKEEVGDLNLEGYRHFVANLTDENIIARSIYSPLDLERSSPNSFVRGDVHGVAPYFYQTMGHRPTPDLGQFTVPGVERLYLVGPFQHPGGGVFGAGRATAIRMFEELGMDFERLINDQSSEKASRRTSLPGAGAESPEMRLFDAKGEELMSISEIDRDDNALVIKGKTFGTMPMVAKLFPQDLRKAFRLLSLRKVLFILSMPFRRDH